MRPSEDMRVLLTMVAHRELGDRPCFQVQLRGQSAGCPSTSLVQSSAIERSTVLQALSDGMERDEAVSLGIPAPEFEAWLDVVNDRSPRLRQLRSKTAPELRTLLEVRCIPDVHQSADTRWWTQHERLL